MLTRSVVARSKPEITPFLAAAQARGCKITSGKDMFEAQIRLVTAFLVGRETL